MTQKTGQKCTAIRRIFVPLALVDRVKDDLLERIGGVVMEQPGGQSFDGPGRDAAHAAARRRREDRSPRVRREAILLALAMRSRSACPRGKASSMSADALRRRPSRTAVVHDTKVFGPVTDNPISVRRRRRSRRARSAGGRGDPRSRYALQRRSRVRGRRRSSVSRRPTVASRSGAREDRRTGARTRARCFRSSSTAGLAALAAAKSSAAYAGSASTASVAPSKVTGRCSKPSSESPRRKTCGAELARREEFD